jgi:hypothetical protein
MPRSYASRASAPVAGKFRFVWILPGKRSPACDRRADSEHQALAGEEVLPRQIADVLMRRGLQR